MAYTNLLTRRGATQMVNGVTFTLNNDGTYLVNGKATADAHFAVDTVALKEGTYAIFNNGHEFWTYMNYYNETTKKWVNVSEANTSMKNAYKKVVITKNDVTAKKSGNSFKFAFWIPKGTVCENLIFKPMLTSDLTAPAKTYVSNTQTKGITNTMASVSIKRGTKQVIDNTSLKDGRLYFTTDQSINKIYTDIPDGQGGLERISIGGGTEVDTALSTTSTNPVQNKVITTNINTINTNLSNIASDVSDLQLGLQSAEDSITNAFEVNAPIENSPSTHNYAVGDYLIWNGALRIVTQTISTGQALTNSNTRLTNTGKELSQINADLSDILPTSGTMQTRVVFGVNDSSGVYASSDVPFLNADKKNLVLTSVKFIGDNTERVLSCTINEKTAFSFNVLFGNSTNVASGKCANVTFSFS